MCLCVGQRQRQPVVFLLNTTLSTDLFMFANADAFCKHTAAVVIREQREVKENEAR